MDTRTPLINARFKSVNFPDLPPIRQGEYASDLTERRDKFVKTCSNWRKNVRFNIVMPNKTPGRSRRLTKLAQERDMLLICADDLATSISNWSSWDDGLAMAHQIKVYLAEDLPESEKYLIMWTVPNGAPSDQAESLVEIQLVATVLLIAGNLYDELTQRITYQTPLNAAHHLRRLLRRLLHCPLVRRHDDRFRSEQTRAKYRIVFLAQRGAKKFMESFQAANDPWDLGTFVDAQGTTAPITRFHYLEACMLEMLCIYLQLPKVVSDAKKHQEILQSEAKFPVTQHHAVDMRNRAKEIMNGMIFTYRYCDLHPALMSDAKQFQKAEIMAATKKWTYSSINGFLEPGDMEKVADTLLPQSSAETLASQSLTDTVESQTPVMSLGEISSVESRGSWYDEVQRDLERER